MVTSAQVRHPLIGPGAGYHLIAAAGIVASSAIIAATFPLLLSSPARMSRQTNQGNAAALMYLPGRCWRAELGAPERTMICAPSATYAYGCDRRQSRHTGDQ
jgi:hypothetical protein